MHCTAAEIEEKHRLAKEKLLLKHRTKCALDRHSTHPPAAKISKHFSIKPDASTGSDILGRRSLSSPSPQKIMQPNSELFNKKQSVFKYAATCVLESMNSFTVKLSKYFNVALEIFKTIPSRKYDPKTSNWSFHLNDYQLLLKKLEVLQGELVVHRLPAWIHHMHKNTATNSSCFDFTHIDEELRNTLMPFQEESLCFAVQRNGRCYIADEMGMGKTLQALAIAAYYRTDWPILVVTTASTCSSWEMAICKFLPSIPLPDIQAMSTKSFIESPAVLIASYDMMNRRIDDLLRSRCGVCIFDEAHTLKNFRTKCFKAALSLSKSAKRVILLSGTPALAKPSELFTQLQLIDELFFGSFLDFSRRYCDAKESTFGWDATGCSHLDELQIVLEQRFMLRRTKAGVCSLNLPDKSQEIVELNMNVAMNAVDKAQLQRVQATDFKREIKNDTQILQLFHNMAIIKIPAVISYLQQIVKEEQRKFLVFAHHLSMLDAVEKVLCDSRIEYIRIDGKCTNRAELVRRFQFNGNVRCALLSIMAANSGITLTAAQLVIFTELHWTPSILAQAEARAHRIGQQCPVTVRYLIAPKTIDDYIWQMLQSKQTTLKDMNLTSESYSKMQVVAARPKSAENRIDHYFSPSKRCADASMAKRAKKCENANANVEGSGVILSDNEKLQADDEIDDIFKDISTQQIFNNSSKVPIASDEMFNDGLDDVFLQLDF